MTPAIYPPDLRENFNASIYCEIAMEAYYRTTCIYKEIEEQKFAYSAFGDLTEMYKSVVTTVVFSAMCVESFLNNYAAACLGDAEFYENYDRLSAVSKFQLVAKFILKANVEKGDAYYGGLKRLFRERDAYVHNKSKRSSYQGMSEEEYAQYVKDRSEMEQEAFYEENCFDKEEANELLRSALNALKSVRDVAHFFDAHDSEAYAMEHFFHTAGVLYGKPLEQKYKKVVFPALGIKVDEKHEI